MNDSPEEYHISFFKPTTRQAHFNRNLVVWLVLVWFAAIFGFQILLRVLQEPTPEPAYLAFRETWSDVKNSTATAEQWQQFGKANLSVLGKIAVEPGEIRILENALNWSVLQLAHDTMQAGMKRDIALFERLRHSIHTISDPEYIIARQLLSAETSPLLELDPSDVRTVILPLHLVAGAMEPLATKTVRELPGIMEKYLVHNQSVLTDTRFLGFPFHYFYTAVLLLVLFVGLCWLYCVRTDRLYKKLSIED